MPRDYDKREEARAIANSAQFKPVGAQFKRQSGPGGRRPESPARFSPNGARSAGSPNARLGVPASYGPPNQRVQGGVGGDNTAGADQSGTGVGNPQASLTTEFGVGRAAQAIASGAQSAIGGLGKAINPNIQPAPTPTTSPSQGTVDSVNFSDIPITADDFVDETTYNTDFGGSELTQRKADMAARDIANAKQQDLQNRLGTPVGDSDFFKKTNAAGATRYEDAQGNVLTNSDLTNRYGNLGGSLSVLGGPGDNRDLDLDTREGRAEGIRRNVAAYDRQTAAIRDLREARNPGITTARNNLTLGNTGGSTGDEQTYTSFGLPSVEERNARVGEEDVRSLGQKKYNAETRRLAQQVARDRNRLTARGQDIQQRLGLVGEETERLGDVLAYESSAADRMRKGAEFAADYNLEQQKLILNDRKARALEKFQNGQLKVDRAKLSNSGYKNIVEAIDDASKTYSSSGPDVAYRQLVASVGIEAANTVFPEQGIELGQIER